MGFLLEPGVPLRECAPLPKLTEELMSSEAEVSPLFRLPGLGIS